MGKRRRSMDSESENWNDEHELDSIHDSEAEDEDASFHLKPKPSTSRKKTHATARKKSKHDVSTASVSDEQNAHVDIPLHPKSAHTILSRAAVRTALLKWYQTVHHIRGMPWRRAYDPSLGANERAQRAYEVWISEIMLQQTQVVTVIPYYNRWMEKFPTIRDLAGATIDEVNSLWKGLGYYSRASRLLAGAQKAVKQYDAKLPDNAKDMEANIPGIGRYSAGAICSIAYGERVPVLDGNVHRLLSRILALHASPKAKSTLDVLWAAAQTMVEIEDIPVQSSSSTQPQGSTLDSLQHPGDINQALIELGSTICKVRDPDCQRCPLQTWCSAYQKSIAPDEQQFDVVIDIEDICGICEPVPTPLGVTSYPMKAGRKKVREELDIVHVVEWHPKVNPENRYFLMIKRPASGLLAGLCDFPTSVDVSATISRCDQDALASEILKNLVQGYQQPTSETPDNNLFRNPDVQAESVMIVNIQPVGEVLHIFSHIRKTYRVQWIVLEGGVNPPAIWETLPIHEERSNRGSNKKPRKDQGAVKGANIKSDGPKSAKWIHLDQVIETNMGNGVVKVWNLVKKLWESATEQD